MRLHLIVVTMTEVEDGDEYEEDDEQNPDLTSALPRDLKHVPLEFKRLPVEETIQRSLEFYNLMSTRRTVRFFSSDPIPADVIRNIIRAAGTLSALHMKLLLL
jgi:iodotyrosine deiodinase